MKATTRRGAAGGLPVNTTTTKKAAARGFMCGCGGSKSVSTVSCAAAANISAVTTPLRTSSTATKATSVKPALTAKTTAAAPVSRDAEGTPSVDALLRQLSELERGVRALGVREVDGGARGSVQACRRSPPRRHRRSASEWGAGRGRLEEESVVVVTESADPLGDFRRSMAQMVVENEITGDAELRELLQRFLSLNSARHHHLILRAFADVWEELFAGGGDPLPRPYKPRTTALEPANVHTVALY